MPNVTQVVEVNDVCDEELEETEGMITYTQSVEGVTVCRTRPVNVNN